VDRRPVKRTYEEQIKPGSRGGREGGREGGTGAWYWKVKVGKRLAVDSLL